MLVLKTTSPWVFFSAPKEKPSYSEWSSRMRRIGLSLGGAMLVRGVLKPFKFRFGYSYCREKGGK